MKRDYDRNNNFSPVNTNQFTRHARGISAHVGEFNAPRPMLMSFVEIAK